MSMVRKLWRVVGSGGEVGREAVGGCGDGGGGVRSVAMRDER